MKIKNIDDVIKMNIPKFSPIEIIMKDKGKWTVKELGYFIGIDKETDCISYQVGTCFVDSQNTDNREIISRGENMERTYIDHYTGNHSYLEINVLKK